MLPVLREPTLHIQSQMNHANYHHHGKAADPSERIEDWLAYLQLTAQAAINETSEKSE